MVRLMFTVSVELWGDLALGQGENNLSQGVRENQQKALSGLNAYKILLMYI